jgi:HK97 family phage major capsid protein
MPTGIMTRLAQAAQPSDWDSYAPTWTDLRATNLLKIDGTLTDIKFYQAMIKAMGTPKPNYGNGGLFWIMNPKTFSTLQAKALVFNAAGAIVSGQTHTMPIIGGNIVTLEFVPENDIIGGYGSLYLLAQRHGMALAQSEHLYFLDDQTVFKGTARYDGKPIFGEGFVAININNQNLTTTATFAPDTANAETPEA